jgi:alpha-N-arabinofuranosidase
MFYNAIKGAYPNINIISSIWVGYFTTPPPVNTIQDLHDYLSVEDIVSKFNGYDNADRNYPVLVGEYAAIYDDEHIISSTIQHCSPRHPRRSTS